MTALHARVRTVGKGHARQDVVTLHDQWGIQHTPAAVDYLPLDYRVRVDCHVRHLGSVTFPAWVPLTRCGEPSLPAFIRQ